MQTNRTERAGERIYWCFTVIWLQFRRRVGEQIKTPPPLERRVVGRPFELHFEKQLLGDSDEQSGGHWHFINPASNYTLAQKYSATFIVRFFLGTSLCVIVCRSTGAVFRLSPSPAWFPHNIFDTYVILRFAKKEPTTCTHTHIPISELCRAHSAAAKKRSHSKDILRTRDVRAECCCPLSATRLSSRQKMKNTSERRAIYSRQRTNKGTRAQVRVRCKRVGPPCVVRRICIPNEDDDVTEHAVQRCRTQKRRASAASVVDACLNLKPRTRPTLATLRVALRWVLVR